MNKLKIIKFLLFIVICSIFSYGMFGQNIKFDSLQNLYNNATHDTTRIKLLLDFGEIFEAENPDTAIFFYNKALSLAQTFRQTHTIDNKQSAIINKLEASSLRYIGIVYDLQGNYLIAFDYYLKSLKIFEKLGNKKGVYKCYINIGNILMYQGNYQQSIDYFLRALKITEELNNKKGMSDCYNNIGLVQYYQGIYPQAIENYLKSLKITEELNDKKGMSNCYNNIGLVHSYQGNYTQAIEYYLKSLKIFEQLGDKNGLSACYTNIGSVYTYQGNYPKAIENHLKALKINEQLGNKKGMSNCYVNIGNAHMYLGNYHQANEDYLKSLKITKELGDKNGMALVYGNIASINISLFDSAIINEKQRINYINKAIEFGTKAIELSIEIKAMPMENSSANTLMNAYKKLGNYKKSIEYADIYIATKDSMFSEEKTKSLAEMGAKYESEKRELTIQKLEKEQLLQNETIARKNAESKKQRILIFSFLAGFLIILVFSIFLYRLFIQKKLANLILSQQKEEISAQRDEIETQRDLVTVQKEHIEEIHKEVTDSINYAERIQRSFLATKELLDENLNSLLRGVARNEAKQSTSTLSSLRGTKQSFEDETNYFVFFKPKDVVSGDFYWAGKLNNGNFALATADSTGHGVPGAIMSILNISSIEKAIEQGICEPSEILNHTRKTIIERLKKDGSPEGGKDGMDASLICFDFETQKLTYSAANNPIWIIRLVTQSSGLLIEPEVRVTGEDASANLKLQTSNFKLFELSHDKMPIGKHDKDQISFTQHDFQLQKGDVIYTLTDGYEDQFGGPKGKKFMTKNLKQLLIANCQLSMKEQKRALEKTLSEWIGESEQTDDITIIGLRLN